jgi:hypothetical protein
LPSEVDELNVQVPALVTRLPPLPGSRVEPSGEMGNADKQEAVVPLTKLLGIVVQNQLHGPVPLMAEAVPALQRPVVGLLARWAPFDAPQAARSTFAVHSMSFPPFNP